MPLCEWTTNIKSECKLKKMALGKRNKKNLTIKKHTNNSKFNNLPWSHRYDNH